MVFTRAVYVEGAYGRSSVSCWQATASINCSRPIVFQPHTTREYFFYLFLTSSLPLPSNKNNNKAKGGIICSSLVLQTSLPLNFIFFFRIKYLLLLLEYVCENGPSLSKVIFSPTRLAARREIMERSVLEKKKFRLGFEPCKIYRITWTLSLRRKV